MHTMCGADLSDLEEENPRDCQGNPYKKTGKDKAQYKGNETP
jgi:hypothetical protein